MNVGSKWRLYISGKCWNSDLRWLIFGSLVKRDTLSRQTWMFCSIVRKRVKKLAVHGSSKMAVKVWFHKTVFSDNTKEVSFKPNRLFLLQACYEYTESNLRRLENRWKRTSKLKQTKNLHASPGSVLSFHSSRQTAMKQSMEFHDAHSQNLNGWFSFCLTCSKLLFCYFWAFYKSVRKTFCTSEMNEDFATAPFARLSSHAQK